ncbi:hypothetical protein B0A50_03477 [Salinomyces thailandicus]|uniref:Mitochondrial seryl-tRNA synthetase n=1 Tax=Salinomyces thailandicus TaxID=706561 RepID=A0A4U0U3T1_9PEZI|nr:hypothetical protein B0A50_03477 [Salinomyces thailandica]
MLGRRLYTTLFRSQPLIRRNPLARPSSTSTPNSAPKSTPTPTSRIARLEARLPRFLQHLTKPLRNAPLSHITAFLILHEITAILPVIALTATFHYTHWLPPFLSEGKWISDGVEMFGRYFRRKGWISDAQEARAEAEVGGEGGWKGEVSRVSGKWWGRGEGGTRLVVEIAAAYAVTKALLPLRLVISVWATPWFARWTLLPITGFVKRMVGRSKVKATPAAGTGAVGGGVLPKDAGGKGP